MGEEDRVMESCRPKPVGEIWSHGEPGKALARAADLERCNQLAAAKALYQQLVKLPEIGPVAGLRAAWLCLRQRDEEGARRFADRALELAGDKDFVLFQHGWIAFESGRFEACIASWEALRRRYPEHPSLGLALERAGLARVAEHIRCGELATALAAWPPTFATADPERDAVLAELHFRAAVRRLRGGGSAARSEACRHLETGHRLTPDDHRFRRHLARCQEPAGSREAVLQAGWRRLEGGARQRALEILEEALRHDPLAAPVLHAFTLACYHTARNAAASSGSGDLWRLVIGAWAMLFHHHEFWRQWVERRRSSYRAAGSLSDLEGCRERLGVVVRGLLEEAFTETDEPRQLRILLHRELAAAALWSTLGGWPLAGEPAGEPVIGGAERRLVCGPLMVRWLGLEPELGRFLAGLEKGVSPRVEEARRRFARLAGSTAPKRIAAPHQGLLLRYFSGLGPAQALLELERPQEALAELEELCCPRCAAAGRGPAGEVRWPPVCAQSCPDFDTLHPAFAAMAGKARGLAGEARALAAEAHIEVGLGRLRAEPVEVFPAVAAFREAQQLADGARPMARRLVEAALGRARALTDSDRREVAVELLEAASPLFGDGGEQRAALDGYLAELLTERGILAGNARPPRFHRAVLDLRRAVRLNPHAGRALLNLGLALEARAQECADHEPGEAERLLGEGLEILDRARHELPDPKEIEQRHDEMRQALDRLRARRSEPESRRDSKGRRHA